MEQACSNIVKPRTSDDHTNYRVRARTECKIGQEAIEYWSASNLMWQFRLLHPRRTWGITRDGQGRHHLPPTPQPWKGKCIHRFLHTQVPCLHTQKLPKSPWVPDPMDRQVKDLGTPEGTMNHHLNLALILLIQVIWMIKHRVIYVMIISHKLYTSSYIMIITQEL